MDSPNIITLVFIYKTPKKFFSLFPPPPQSLTRKRFLGGIGKKKIFFFGPETGGTPIGAIKCFFIPFSSFFFFLPLLGNLWGGGECRGGFVSVFFFLGKSLS